jgi:hypothetical protein
MSHAAASELPAEVVGSTIITTPGVTSTVITAQRPHMVHAVIGRLAWRACLQG